MAHIDVLVHTPSGAGVGRRSPSYVIGSRSLLYVGRSTTSMERLSNELLRDILDFIQLTPDHVLNIDRRAYLSVESFKAPSPPLPAQAHDVASFRLVCRRFAELGAPYQFTRVTTRFSRKGFVRLEGIAGSPGIARHVKKFSYMIPCFYLEGNFMPLLLSSSTVVPLMHGHDQTRTTSRSCLRPSEGTSIRSTLVTSNEKRKSKRAS